MTTMLENPNDDDKPRKRDGYADWIESKEAMALMRKVEAARTAAEEAKGTNNHPRLAMVKDVAQLELDHGILTGKFKALEDYCHALNTQLQQERAAGDYMRQFIEGIPQRLLILENSYAHLAMQAHSNSYVEKVIEAYKIGQKAKEKNNES